jgi:hypothetical protein
MPPTEHANKIVARIATIGQAADEAIVEVEVLLTSQSSRDALRWLPDLRATLRRIQLDCAEASFVAREMRNALPTTDALQPRLL